MKKYYLIALVLFVFCFGFIHQQHLAVIAKKNSGGIDYTADANCMGAWFMNNNGGNETDRSGEGGTLIQTSGTIPTSETVPSGYSGTSRDFESGDTEYLEHANNLATDISGADQAITYAAWIKPEDNTSDTMHIISKYDNVNGSRQYSLIHATAANRFQCNISSDGNTYSSASGETPIDYDGSWMHVACVYDDTDIRLYVNGTLDENGIYNPAAFTAGIYAGNEEFRVGAEDDDNYFDGLIDEVIVFNRALEASEILEMYNSGIRGNTGGSD